MLTIRPETPADYAQIADLHILAFNNQTDEATIVALLRQRQSYTPALSLVAERDGRIVGHGLFTPSVINLMGQQVNTVLLAPLGVLPEYQGQGIGAEIMHVGHKTAKEMGFHLGMLLGHSDYYPRFGYRTGAFGDSKLKAYVPRSQSNAFLTTRAPLQKDVSLLFSMWRDEESAVDFAIRPELRLADWLSLNQQKGAVVYLHGDSVVGYVRGMPNDIKVFIAMNDEAAIEIVADLCDDQPITLPLHPNSVSTRGLGIAECTAWDAGMAVGLTDEGEALLDQYFEAVENGSRPVGRPIWNTAFG